MIDLEEFRKKFKETSKEYWAKYRICDACKGVGCLPEHFGMGNPNAQACYNCNGKGAVERQLKLL